MKTWWWGIDLRITRVRFPQITGALNFLQCGVLSTVRLIVTQRTAGSIPVQCTAYTYSSIQVYWSTYCSVQVHQYDSSVYQSKTTAECEWKPSAPRLSEEPSMRPIWPALGLPLNFRTIQCNNWSKYKQANKPIQSKQHLDYMQTRQYCTMQPLWPALGLPLLQNNVEKLCAVHSVISMQQT